MSLDKFNPQAMQDEHLLPAVLLEMGDTLNFIETRKHSLRTEIKASKLDAGVGKVSGLAGMAGGAGLLLISNPLGGIVIAGGAVCYGMAVFAQWLQTGKLQIMPLSSKTQADRDADLSGATVTGQDAYDVAAIQGARDSIREDAAYLSDREKIEYELLHFSPEGLLSAMNHVHPTQRWACYQFLIDAFLAGTIQSYFANPQALRDVLGNPAIYTSHLPEASKRFPQYGLQSAGAIEGDEARASFQPAAIAGNTRLNAVELQSSLMVQNVASVAQNQASDIVDLILSQGNSLVFLGGQGVGKSRLMAIASRVGLQTGRFRHVTVLSSLAKANEDPHYWQHAQTQAFCDMGSMGEGDRAKALRAFLNAVRQFKTNSNDQNPGLLIIDEIAYLSALLAEAPKEDVLSKQLETEIQDVLRVVSSGGAKRGWFIWLGTPQGAIGDLGNVGRRMKMLKSVLCAIAPGDSVSSRGSAVSWDEGLYQAALRNFPALTKPDPSLANRIVFFQDSWTNQTRYPEPKQVAETMPILNDELDDRTRLETSFSVSDSHPIEQFYHTHEVETDPAIELIKAEPNLQKREALIIAYRWAVQRLEDGKEANREAFIERARKERKNEYLRDNRNEIWEELQALIS